MMIDSNGTQHGGNLKPLLLGNGRLAKHLHHYFHLLNLTHKHFENARDLDSPELHRKLEGVNAIWILTSDRAIGEVKKELEAKIASRNTNLHYTWIHSSAATYVEDTITLHPLMTFGHELYSLDQYQQIPFAAVAAHAGKMPAEKNPLLQFLNLPNPSFHITEDQRALYHAHAVLMSNLPILLWTMASKNAESSLNLAPETFDPILRQTLNNFISQREKALTGPIARGDRFTIDKNLTALRAQPSPLTTIYETFLSSFSYHSERETK